MLTKFYVISFSVEMLEEVEEKIVLVICDTDQQNELVRQTVF